MEVITLEIRTTANISGFCLTCELFVENHSKLGCMVHTTTQPVFQRTCRVSWCDLFTGQMSRNQHCQSTEGTWADLGNLHQGAGQGQGAGRGGGK